MLPIAAGSILLKRCESKSELEHQKYEKYVLHFAGVMQAGINGYEIYKHVGMMHVVVFADRSPGAKNAQVIGEHQNCYRFANPGEALRGFEVWRLRGLII